MTYVAQLESELSAATSDGELLARTQISVAVGYLSQGLRLESSEIRALLDEVLAEAAPEPQRAKLFIVAV